jgi:hypothetical protein
MSDKQVDLLTKNTKMLIKLAHKVRDAFEEISQKESLPTNLCGLCLRSSVQLFLAAQYFGINIQVIGGDGHCYTMCDGHIIDVTATQFGEKERVLVVPPNRVSEYHKCKRWRKDKICESICDIYGIWDESKTFDPDRLIVWKYIEPLMKEGMLWFGSESVACM